MNLFARFFGRKIDPAAEQGTLYGVVAEAIVDVQHYARSHGGFIELVSVSEDGEVSVRLSGTCKGCPMSGVTLKLGIENQLKQLVPGVRKVIAVK